MIEAFYDVSPAWPVIIGGLIAAAVPNHYVRKTLALVAPVLAGLLWFNVPSGVHTGGIIELGGFTLETFRFDGLSRIWGLIFIIAAFINALYGLYRRWPRLKGRMQGSIAALRSWAKARPGRAFLPIPWHASLLLSKLITNHP